MRCLMAGLIALLAISSASAGSRPPEIASTDAALRWVNAYRDNPEPKYVPAVMLALSRTGAFSDPERCGAYIGFLAGVIGSNPAQADKLISRLLPMQSQDRWIIVRAIAYSGLPNWKQLLRRYADRIPTRRVMIQKYVTGKLPTLDQLVIAPAPSGWERMREHFRLAAVFGESKHKIELDPSPDVLDTLWGYYFATRSYGPIMHIVAMLPWAEDHDDAERLTLGSMAKFTLASNAARDPILLDMLRSSSKARHQPEKTIALLDQIVAAAETMELGQVRRQALAAIEELKRKGPAYKRSVSWWGYLGQTTIAAGCIAAAATGQVVLGLPCVIGGATASAAMNLWSNQP